MVTVLVISFGSLLLAMVMHEFAHGWVADRLGDHTARLAGRLTLNPLAHIDPFGTILLPLILFFLTGGRFVFGAAKPVPVNFLGLRNPRRDMVLIGLAGPLANISSAILASALLRFIPSPLLFVFITISVTLGIFNLIPIPPLDGSRVLAGLLPQNLALRYNRLEPWGLLIILLLLQVGGVNSVLWSVIEKVNLFILKPF